MKKASYIVVMVVCALLIVTGFLLRFTSYSYRPLEGFLIGVGMGCFFAAFTHYMNKVREEHDPNLKRANEIDLSDERNIMIRNQAKAKSADIVQWILIITSMLSILFNAPIYFTSIMILIYLIKTILDFYFIGYYAKRM